MSDFDALVAEAEGFEDGFVDVPDDFLDNTSSQSHEPNHQSESTKKRHPLTDIGSQSEKKQKQSFGFLADYFSHPGEGASNKNYLTKNDENVDQQKSSQRCYKCNLEGHWAKDCTAKNALSEGMKASSTNDAPPCDCGMAALQKTVLKDGPNKDRKFWVRLLLPI
jgi:hypothetical protein